MDQKLAFIADHQRELYSMTELCGRFGISRKTGYKWVWRYEEEGLEGLEERSRRPHSCPHESSEEAVGALLEARRRHPTWGPKKLLVLLEKKYPELALPGRSTASEILKRHGMVAPRRRRARRGHPGPPQAGMEGPNDLWTADFKGQFRTTNGQLCYPLTIADGFSRYLLMCQALEGPTHEGTKRFFRKAFEEYGLPHIIRTDNGAPFATVGLGRLSKLSVWWIRLGIFPELIEPGHPEQNGVHERMHRTLKGDTARPPAATLASQQRRFRRFRETFNGLRPHEALDQTPPAELYESSPRPFPSRLPCPQYPDHFEVRKVMRNNGMKWNSQWVMVSRTLIGEQIGLEEIDDGVWTVYFGPLEIARFDERSLRIEDTLGRRSRRKGGTP